MMRQSLIFVCVSCFLSRAIVSAICSKPDITASEPFQRHASHSSRLTCHGQSEIYHIRPSPGKGLGVYALRDLEVGTVIMSEAPTLKIKPPEYIKGTGYPMVEISKLLRNDFIHLNKEAQDEVMNLAYYGTNAELETSDPLALIFKTNAYKSGQKIGLFPKIARINHSCRPNTSYYWDEKANRRVMFANRLIKKGEEIQDSYISLLLPQEHRQKLLAPYGFTCSCEICAVEKDAKKASDQRRMAIRIGFANLRPRLHLTAPATQEEKMKAVKDVKLSVELADLVHEEKLADYYAIAYRAAALTHARTEDWEPATIWANKGYERRVMEDPLSMHTQEMHQLTSNYIESWKSDLRNKSMLTDDT